ncbi:inositol-1,4,5-trisphosphate 5-phosphatase 1 [Aspergillus lentulus]|uniref:SacI domain and endonuclease/exonuclease/phosphatase family protein n=1 Tax=Aspergillus lentulus TaxID=293939 RepID=UPI001392EFAE|nr:inositol-1,4,5-trisphosphate 5-phosphatase 1 [Aspergillus lentulus]GFF53911.1 inositol-1,4,5-trisphosphate 5-phosphatase 1 [Aspergillus lentulus]
MPVLRVFRRDYPQRTLILATTDNVLVFKAIAAEVDHSTRKNERDTIHCLVEFGSLSSVDLTGYRYICDGHGTLGLIALDGDVFLCVVTGASKAATVRPGEAVWRIDNVHFLCLNHSSYEDGLNYESESEFAAEEPNRGENKEIVTDHPFLALKKLLSDGSFYYSLDFDLTDRLQNRSDKADAFDMGSLDEDMLWNSYMINPLLLLRSHLSPLEKLHLDMSRMLTGIDDDGNVANFVETETVLWIPPGLTFSYVQIRGSVPLFWEQAPGFFPGQQRIEVIRSREATKHAFDKHFESLESRYGAVHIVNLLSALKPGEVELSTRFQELVSRSPLNQKSNSRASSNHMLLEMTEFDFHAEARGPLGYGASDQIKDVILHSVDGFGYFLSESTCYGNEANASPVVLQQEGIFRTNCLDCLDRTNLVQTIISMMALESFFRQRGAHIDPEHRLRHSTLWADNGDALSRIYAGTGALKSSFTRHGKMSLAGALADARKTATRLYVNNFSDKARQRTIDLLLGRLTNQAPVQLFDPINDIVSERLTQRASEYSYKKSVLIWTGTFNVNGRYEGPDNDLIPWLFPLPDPGGEDPSIFAVGFQEIVALNPQQIMSTDPTPRKVWEAAVRNCLNNRAEKMGSTKYVLLRSGQLVGAALMIFVKEDILRDIKNVEGSVRKTGLSGISGNKGGCAIRFEYSKTRICFVTAHLAAGFANYEERNKDYETICRGLRFQQNRTIDDHDTIIWLGDFNYRIGLSNQTVRDLAMQRNYQELHDNDQLNLQMMAGNVFQFYSEGLITFPPTYKYNVGTNYYDTSEKSRIPAWCDRILWKGSNIHQLHYDSACLQCSDHRPVWALFSCDINFVDDHLRENIRSMIYAMEIGDAPETPARSKTQTKMRKRESAELDFLTLDLPPASSDDRRWWLDNGMLVKSIVQPPSNGWSLNMNRESNPFSSSNDTDWVPSRLTDSQKAVVNNIDSITYKPPLPPRGGKGPANSSDLIQDTDMRSSRANGAKKAPPIPRKPVALSNDHKALSGQAGWQSGMEVPESVPSQPSNRLGVSRFDLNDQIRTPPAERRVPGSQDSLSVGFGHFGEFERHTDITKDLLDGEVNSEIKWEPLLPK